MTSPIRSIVIRAGAAVAFFAAAATLPAQPPGSGGSGYRGPDPDEIIERLDDNRNGQVDPDEMNGRSRFFLEGLARDNNLDLSKPIPNDKLRELFRARFSGGGSSGTSGSSSGSSRSTGSSGGGANQSGATPLVPGFGVAAATAKVPGFGPVAAADSWDALKAKYDDRVLEQVQDSLRRNDRDGDGVLNAEELKNGQWRSDPLEYDKNKDGKLSRTELAERYKQRYSGGSSGGGPPGGFYGGGPPGGGFYGGPPGGGFMGGGPPGGGGYSGGRPSSSGGPPPSSSATTVASSAGPAPSSSSGSTSGSSSGRPGGSGSSGSSSGGGSSSSSGSTGGGSSSSGGSTGGDDRIARYAEGLLRQYDTNGDGTLQKDEWSRMRGEPQKADRDGNGLITKDELARQLGDYGRGSSGSSSSTGSTSSGSSSSNSSGGGASRSSGGSSSGNTATAKTAAGPRKSYRVRTTAERLPPGLPDWFTRNDADGDGQIAMSEFTTSWSDSKAAEFAGWDHDGDGLVTPKEALGGRK